MSASSVPQYQPGDRVKLFKGTFLDHGIIVRNGCTVTVLSVDAEGGYEVEYRDAENQPHRLSGVAEVELRR
ncbi:hypothetical protein HS125_18785 [bacterium]|nr:hypothetical protein [bacterium]